MKHDPRDIEIARLKASILRRAADGLMANAADATDSRMDLERQLEAAKYAEMIANARVDEADKSAVRAEEIYEGMQ